MQPRECFPDLTCQLMEELQALPLADQDCWLLIHGSLQHRHLP
jgi:hypothetical protein